jgi:filamentous hemagglutinin
MDVGLELLKENTPESMHNIIDGAAMIVSPVKSVKQIVDGISGGLGIVAKKGDVVSDGLKKIDGNVPVKNADGYEISETVTRRDNDFSSPVNDKGVGKSRLDDNGNLIPTNSDADVNVTRHVRNDPSYKNDAPTTSTSEVGGENTPRDYGTDQIQIDTGRLQRDINDGIVTNVDIIPSRQLQDRLQDKVDTAQKRYDGNRSDRNADRLDAARTDFDHAVNDNECLLVGCISNNYIKGGD